MSTQMTMFERELGLGDPLPPYNGTDTSEAAAESIRERAPLLRQRVLNHIAAQPEGATCDEVEVATGLPHQTASARINELHRAGLIVDSGERRRTRSGRTAKVWTARKAAG